MRYILGSKVDEQDIELPMGVDKKISGIFSLYNAARGRRKEKG